MEPVFAIAEKDVLKRLHFDNPWWKAGAGIDKRFSELPMRDYFPEFMGLVADSSINRAVVLMGPRRVGKTVMVYHAIQNLMKSGIPGNHILYLSLETPLYTGIALERLLNLFGTEFDHQKESKLYIFFDEVQYLKDWEIHLKSLVDSYPGYKFVVTGSAAAALKLKSNESGAGRFSNFVLPPLTFAEYLRFIDKELALIQKTPNSSPGYSTPDIDLLNEEFLNYVNFGGYPEAVFSPTIRDNPQQFIRGDIIDKVLLRDLPSLYGISDIQELNRLFTTLAYNTGREISLDTLSKNSNVAKNTIGRYLEYLEAAFLIKRIERVDQNAKRFKRAMSFKVYLTNPSMRAALFGPIDSESTDMGPLAETAIFSQWQHSDRTTLFYAQWKSGEIDIVCLNETTQTPRWAVEVKWSDRPYSVTSELDNCVTFTEQNPKIELPFMVTSHTISAFKEYKNIAFEFRPCSLYAYALGKNLLKNKKPTHKPTPPNMEPSEKD